MNFKIFLLGTVFTAALLATAANAGTNGILSSDLSSSSGGSGGTLGSSAGATSPQRSGEVTTGFFSSGSGLIEAAISGVQVLEIRSLGLIIGDGGTPTVPGTAASIFRTVNSGNAHGFSDETVFHGASSNSFDDSTTVKTVTSGDHHAGFQFRPIIDPTASGTTLGALRGYHATSATAVQNNTTVTDYFAFIANAPTVQAGSTITNMYGFYLDATGANITNSYGVYITGNPTNLWGGGFNGYGTTGPAAKIHLAGAVSSAAWTTSGVGIRQAAATYTDTTSSGTVSSVYINSLGTPTIATSNVTTFTNAASMFIGNAPTAGTNATITNSLSLVVNERSRFHGYVGIGGATVNPTSVLQIGANQSDVSWTTAGKLFAVGGQTLTDTTGSGTITTRVASSFGAPTFASSSSVTVTNGANVYIAGAPANGTNTTVTNPYALWVDAGNTRLDGWLSVGASAAPTAMLYMDGNQSSAAWGAAGIGIAQGSATYTDTSSSGTVAANYVNSILLPTLAASSATTYTNAATIYVSGSPAAGSNVTITNSYGLYVNAGNVRFNQYASFGNVVAPTSVVHIGGNQSDSSWTTAGKNFAVAANTLTDTSGSGTIATRVSNSFGTPTLAASSAVTVTNAATLYVEGAPTAGSNTTLTNTHAVWIDGGSLRADGDIRTATSPLHSATAPTATTFCTSPSIPNNNGTSAFTINVGTSCSTSTGTLTMPTAATGWVCEFTNVTNNASNTPSQTGGTTTTVTLTNYSRTTGLASNWTNSDVIRAQCTSY